MKLAQYKIQILSIAFSLVVLAIIFYLSWLGNFIKNPQFVLYSLGTVILIGFFQAIVALNAISSPAKEKKLEEKIMDKEKLLEEEIDKLKQATDNLALSNEMQEKGNILTTKTFMENERKMEEVWVVIEDLAIFNKDDGGFKNFNLNNTKEGKTYVYFTASDCKASVRDYISIATGEKIDFQGSIKKDIEIGKGKIKFVFVAPDAFLFLSPITIWFPSRERDQGTNKKVFLDFPKYPAGYHLAVEDELAEKIYKRLEELYRKSISRGE
jgi:hypothetical protein